MSYLSRKRCYVLAKYFQNEKRGRFSFLNFFQKGGRFSFLNFFEKRGRFSFLNFFQEKRNSFCNTENIAFILHNNVDIKRNLLYNCTDSIIT